VPTNFPAALDSFPSAVALAANTLNTDPHSVLHGNIGDALAALEAKVGVDGSSVPSSLDYLLSLKAALASPAFTGVPTVPTATLGTNTTQAASTAFVLANAPALPADVARTGVANTFTVGPQTIETGADSNKGLVVKGNSPTQSASLQEWQDSSGTPLVQVLFAGVVYIGAGQTEDGTGALLAVKTGIYTPGWIWATGGLRLTAANTIEVGDISTAVRFTGSGGLQFTTGGGYLRYNSNVGFSVYQTDGSTLGLIDVGYITVTAPAAATQPLIVKGAVSQSAPLVQLQGRSSLNAREQADLDTAWVDSTDATRKARVLLRAWDTAVREVLRGEADGANPLIGFLGANAVGQQSLGAAATDAASTQMLANNIRAALIALGLCKT
jgi:hypothetical protein